jgi:hypothetical protein
MAFPLLTVSNCNCADRSGARSKARTVFDRSNGGIVGLSPTWVMDVCVRLFCVWAVLYVQVAALRRADPPSKESYRLCKSTRNWKASKVQQKVCRADR